MSNHHRIVAFVILAGCATEPNTSTVEEHICGAWLCGSNSPVMDSKGMTDLSLSGVPNASGFVYQGFYKNGLKYTAKVWGGKLTASRYNFVNGFWILQTLSGQGLVNGYFLIGTNDGSGKSFALSVDKVSSVQSWAQPNPPPSSPVMLEQYVLDYTWVTGWLGATAAPPTNLCSNPPAQNLTAAGVLNPETLGQYEYSTLIFEGDRIDDAAKVVTGVDNTWINFGCAGHTLSKLALTGHTEAAKNASNFTTTLDERTTMLKMLAADYCGTGRPFTVTGQPLRWRDDHGTMFYNATGLPQINTTTNSTNAMLEARWTPTGPHCLHRTRVDYNPSTLAKQTNFVDDTPVPNPWPGVYAQMVEVCPNRVPPDCTDTSFALDGFHLTSVTPAPSVQQPAPP